jgi:hypothetical protein
MESSAHGDFATDPQNVTETTAFSRITPLPAPMRVNALLAKWKTGRVFYNKEALDAFMRGEAA